MRVAHAAASCQQWRTPPERRANRCRGLAPPAAGDSPDAAVAAAAPAAAAAADLPRGCCAPYAQAPCWDSACHLCTCLLSAALQHENALRAAHRAQAYSSQLTGGGMSLLGSFKRRASSNACLPVWHARAHRAGACVGCGGRACPAGAAACCWGSLRPPSARRGSAQSRRTPPCTNRGFDGLPSASCTSQREMGGGQAPVQSEGPAALLLRWRVPGVLLLPGLRPACISEARPRRVARRLGRIPCRLPGRRHMLRGAACLLGGCADGWLPARCRRVRGGCCGPRGCGSDVLGWLGGALGRRLRLRQGVAAGLAGALQGPHRAGQGR